MAEDVVLELASLLARQHVNLVTDHKPLEKWHGDTEGECEMCDKLCRAAEVLDEDIEGEEEAAKFAASLLEE
jgi:hypothetical protein